MIVIVDTGGANHASIQNALLRLGQGSEISADPARIRQSSRLVLPGVGHAGYAMNRLLQNDLVELIRGYQKPVLGICLGMQILFSHSEEGNANCLGIFPGRVFRLEASEEFRVPRIGWSRVSLLKPSSFLLKGIDPRSSFYFVHSYRAPAGPWIVAETTGPQPLPAAVEHRNFFATQFHPERSGEAGAQLLRNFLEVSL